MKKFLESHGRQAVTGLVGLAAVLLLARLVFWPNFQFPANEEVDELVLVLAIVEGFLVIPIARLFLWCTWVYLRLPYVRNKEEIIWSSEFSEKEGEVERKRKRFRPLYVPKEFLFQKRFFRAFGGRWSYGLLVLDDKDELVLRHEGFPTLSADLRRATHGVYSTAGRKFVYGPLQRKKSVYRPDEVENRPSDVKSQIGKWLMHPSESRTIDLQGAPLLWCGAGVIPIVKWRKPGTKEAKFWCMLFFRDLKPVCHAPMVGGAEREKERRYPRKLSMREFCEEALVVSEAPSRGRKMNLLKFDMDESDLTEEEKVEDELYGYKLSDRYRKYRRQKEKIKIDRDDNPRTIRVVYIRPIPFRIEVEDRSKTPAKDAFFIVNPLNSAVDCFRIAYFDLGDYYPIYGEMREEGHPQRSPIVLLELGFLRDVYKNGGEAFPDLPTLRDVYMAGKKICEEIPNEAYFMFDKDLALADLRKKDLIEKRNKRMARLNKSWLNWLRNIGLKHLFELTGVELRELDYLENKGSNQSVNRGEILEQIQRHQATGQPIRSATGSPAGSPDWVTEPFLVLGGTVWQPLEFAFKHTCLRSNTEFETFLKTNGVN